ncbi:HK97 family phage prohead protease [Streptomyces sp. DSM 42041]|uniref:HK97 family phage prohead protease n=1 Tax=Streptomyces hazeniae TaxID=3075538 RepID=A0ABU2NXT2_9ACTN|nr:HK97 family phage prohead protease [Streptomyces sp. DSM 42041]MDT0381426.1 HK97 family phage prohead protease [Streptomyces sp. DSM 42041]
MRTKDAPARVKAAGPDDGLTEGQFVALVSVFDNEDSMGDVVRAGAFTETLAAWGEKGDPIPVIWSHAWGDPFAHIGSVVKATETLAGLEITGQIEDLDSNPTAQQVYRLLKGRRVTQFSFAYDIEEEAFVTDDDHRWGGYFELRRLKLHEVGPCLVGANQETELIAAKATRLAQGAKAGRVLSQANYDRLSSAHEAIGDVLAAAEPEKSAGPGRPASPEPAAATAPAAPADGPVDGGAPQDGGDQPPQQSTDGKATPGTRDTEPTGSASAGGGAADLRLRADLAVLLAADDTDEE